MGVASELVLTHDRGYGDGFATETQKRELRLLRTRLDALPETPAKKEP